MSGSEVEFSHSGCAGGETGTRARAASGAALWPPHILALGRKAEQMLNVLMVCARNVNEAGEEARHALMEVPDTLLLSQRQLDLLALVRGIILRGEIPEHHTVYTEALSKKADTYLLEQLAGWEINQRISVRAALKAIDAFDKECERNNLARKIVLLAENNEPVSELAARLCEIEDADREVARLCPAEIWDAPEPARPLWEQGPQPGTFGLLIGDSGVGKTMAALTLALQVSTGRAIWPSCGPTKKGRAMLVTYEDSAAHLRRRLLAIAEASGMTEEEVREALESGRLTVFCELHEPMYTPGRHGEMRGTKAAERIQAWARRIRPDLIFFDPLTGIMNGPENENTAVNAVVQDLSRMATQTGACVVLCHHTGKTAVGDAGQHASRGASSLTARARWVLRLLNDPQTGGVAHVVAKHSYGPAPDAVGLQRVEGGALLEFDVQAEMEGLALRIAEWVAANPGKQVSRGGLAQGKGGAGLMIEALGSTASMASMAAEVAVAQGLLAVEMRRSEGGGRVMEVLVAGG